MVPVAPSKLKFVIVVCVPPKAIVSSPIVTDELAKEPFAIFVSVLSGPLIVLFVNVLIDAVVATELSIENVNSFDAIVEVIPVPPVAINVSPKEIVSVVELSSLIVIIEFVNELFGILDSVLSEPLIVLFSKVSVDVSVTIEPSVAKVISFPDTEVVIPEPPVNNIP